MSNESDNTFIQKLKKVFSNLLEGENLVERVMVTVEVLPYWNSQVNFGILYLNIYEKTFAPGWMILIKTFILFSCKSVIKMAFTLRWIRAKLGCF